jgi:hypothetical protein
MAVYLIDGERVADDDAAFASALAAAHARHRRPVCLCKTPGADMYVAQLGQKFIAKRMPGTGSLHAPNCPSYEPPAQMSGLSQVTGTAITELPDAGITLLKLDFALSRSGPRAVNNSRREDSPNSVQRIDRGLTLRGLLHYLWDQAELTRWQPGFAGRRTWSVVRRHLLAAAEGKLACGRPLQNVLFAPEPFFVERRDGISQRRTAHWARETVAGGSRLPLMLLLGEVKEIVPARFGHVAVIKHVPDQPFALDAHLYQRMTTRFSQELMFWGASPNLHMVMLATFAVSSPRVPVIEEVLLMPTDAQWIPVEDAFDLQLLHRLQRTGRRFARNLRYDAPQSSALPTAVLLDTSDPPTPLHIERPAANRPRTDSLSVAMPGNWVWDVSRPMPPLPGVCVGTARAQFTGTANSTHVLRALP